MRIFVSSVTATMRRLVTTDARQRLGHLLTPANGSWIEALLDTGLPFGVDNGAFAQLQARLPFNWAGYRRFIQKLLTVWHADPRLRSVLRFVVAPDTVGDSRRTCAMWRAWQYAMPQEPMRSHGRSWRRMGKLPLPCR